MAAPGTETGSIARVAQGSRPGAKSRTNEDSVLVNSSHGGALFCAVADGVGGLDRGDVASKAAIQALAGAFPDQLGDDPAAVLRDAALAAHEAVLREAGGTDGGAGGATTLVAAAIQEGDLWVANAGDSRAYLLTPGRGIAQITADHSWVQEQVRAGAMNDEEAATHPHRKVITRCLGGPEPPEVDVFYRRMVPGSRLLLCSDGLTEVVRSSELAQVLSDNEPQQAVSALLEIADQRGAMDDATVCVVEPEIPPLPFPDLNDETTRQHRALASGAPGRRSYARLLLWLALPPSLLLLGATLLRATDDVITPGVMVAGVELGGRSPQEASAAITVGLMPSLSCSQVLTVGSFRWTGPAGDLGLSVDGAATAAAAWRLGHEGTLENQARDRLDIALKGAIVAPVMRLDQEVLATELERVAGSYVGQEPGWAVDLPAAVGLVSRRLVEEPCAPVELPAKPLPPPPTGPGNPAPTEGAQP